MSNFFNWSKEEASYLPTISGYLLMIVVLIAVIFFILKLHKDNSQKMTVKELVFCAMAMALALVTSMIKLSSLPFGGSVTLFSMFFITMIGYIYGLKVGLVTGIAYGFLQLIMGPYIYHPIQVLFDYPLAFGSLGLSGLCSKKKNGIITGYVIGVIGRYIMHVISGYIFFKSYAPEGMNPMIYTLGYNATYIVPEMVLTIMLLLIPAVSNSIRRVRSLAEQPLAN